MKLYSIKPLEWVKKGVCCLESLDPASGYYILLMGNGMWGWSRNGRGDIEPCDTLNEAKSKAQEDWNNRISQHLTEYKEEK